MGQGDIDLGRRIPTVPVKTVAVRWEWWGQDEDGEAGIGGGNAAGWYAYTNVGHGLTMPDGPPPSCSCWRTTPRRGWGRGWIGW